MNSIDQVGAVCEQLQQRLIDTPGLISTEADAQAELHSALLHSFPERIAVKAGADLLTHKHHVWPLQGYRAYREISAGSSRATPRSDIVLLRDEPQVLLSKVGGAPARFGQPAACLVEIKLDIGRSAEMKIPNSVVADFEKWAAQIANAESDSAVAVIFTDRPDTYRRLGNPNVLPIECSGKRHHEPTSNVAARDALREAIAHVAQLHRSRPLSMLREKDFETQILAALRSDARIPAVNAVTQHRLTCPRTSRLRPVDIAVFGSSPSQPAGVAELKTSHSATFKTLGRAQLEDEAGFLDALVAEGSHGEVAIFRYGDASGADDQLAWKKRWPGLNLTYAEC